MNNIEKKNPLQETLQVSIIAFLKKNKICHNGFYFGCEWVFSVIINDIYIT